MTPATALPPGPDCPWFGLPLLRAMRRDYLGFAQALHRRHGDAVTLRIGPEHTVDLFHPDLIRELLVDHAGEVIRWERATEVFEQAHGRSVLVTEGATWQRQRRMLQPGFGPKRMAGYAALMATAAAGSLARWAPDARGTLDLDHALTELTMDVILRTLFGSGVREDALDAERAVKVIGEAGMREMFWPVTLPDWLPLPGKAAKRWALRTLDALVRSHIAARQDTPATSDDLLGMLLAVRDDEGNGRGLDPQEVRDQCMTIFLAGHETTAAALIWWAWRMACHPDSQDRAAEEVARVLGGRSPTHDDLPRLAWLGQTLKEAMRLHPPAPVLFSRRLQEPVAVGPWVLPRGALVRLTPWVVHRDPRWYDDPERFDPGRFAPQAQARVPRGAYLPFGTGPRVCIGSLFAITEMTLLAAMVLQRFRLRLPDPAPPVRAELNVTLRPAAGMPLVLEPRPRP